jgi:acyl phosphate:glycerol-3-phosphate acyltransferase
VEAVAYIVTAFGAYLLGSIPTGFLVAKARGVDIRTVGSGNMGATNVFRILGKGPGTLVLIVDALKGFLAVAAVIHWYPELSEAWPGIFGVDGQVGNAFRLNLGVVSGFAAILGHNYTCWLRFKGGKGIATSAGVLLALIPKTLAVAFATFLVGFGATRYVSIGSLAAAAAVPVATWWFYPSPTLRTVAALMGALAIYKHKVNIQRLLNGTEGRLGKKPSPPKDPPP